MTLSHIHTSEPGSMALIVYCVARAGSELVIYFSRRRRSAIRPSLKLPSRTSHTYLLFFVTHLCLSVSVRFCIVYTQHIRGFSVYHRELFCRIPILPPTGRKKVEFQRFNRHRKLNFRCRCNKKYWNCVGFFIRCQIWSWIKMGKSELRNKSGKLLL